MIFGMVTVLIAFAIGFGIFAFVWHVVRRNSINAFGPNAAMTFTPPAFEPTLEGGSLVYDSNGKLVQVPSGKLVQFDQRHERYTKIAEVITTLSSASLLFLANSRLTVYPHSYAFVVLMFGFSVFYCIGFMAMLTYYYEGFLYFPASYSPTKYGFICGLGFSALACFALAYLWLALRVGWAVIYAPASRSVA